MNVHPHYDFIYRAKQAPRADLVAAALAEELTTPDALQAKTQELAEKFEQTDKSLNRWEWVDAVFFGLLMSAATLGAFKKALNPLLYAHGISPLNVSALLLAVIFGCIFAVAILTSVVRERNNVLEATCHALGLLEPVTSSQISIQMKSIPPEAQAWMDYALSTRGAVCYFDLKIMRGLQAAPAA